MENGLTLRARLLCGSAISAPNRLRIGKPITARDSQEFATFMGMVRDYRVSTFGRREAAA